MPNDWPIYDNITSLRSNLNLIAFYFISDKYSVLHYGKFLGSLKPITLISKTAILCLQILSSIELNHCEIVKGFAKLNIAFRFKVYLSKATPKIDILCFISSPIITKWCKADHIVVLFEFEIQTALRARHDIAGTNDESIPSSFLIDSHYTNS